MKTNLIIAVDLGLLRAYREVQGRQDREPHLKLVQEVKPKAAHEKLSEQVTDQAGRFPRGSGANMTAGDLSAGEHLAQEGEQIRRILAQLAKTINALIGDDGVTGCSLAVSAPIHKQLLEALDPKARAKIGQILASNLARTDPQELRGHFAKASSS